MRTNDDRLGQTDYEYDAAHSLVALRHKGVGLSFQADLSGNLSAKPGLTGVRMGAANQLQATADETIKYNHRGHIAQRLKSDGNTYYYGYNALDQLEKVTDDSGFHWVASYDGLGRRIVKEWTDGFESHKTEFYWDNRRLAVEIQDEQRVRIYVYPRHRSFVPIIMIEYDSPDQDSPSGRRFDLLYDQRGQVVEVLDASGSSVWSASVQPYGEVNVRSADGFQFPLRLPGQYCDSEIGLSYNRYRYYDDGLGRYIQVDPLGIAGGLNVYSYPANPLTCVDLEGLHKSGKKKVPKKSRNGQNGVADSSVASPGTTTRGPVLATTKQAQEAAENLGFKKANAKSHGQAVFTDGKRFITPDIDGHNGGVWKMAKSVKDLGRKNTRMGTYDANLNRIGD